MSDPLYKIESLVERGPVWRVERDGQTIAITFTKLGARILAWKDKHGIPSKTNINPRRLSS